MAEWKVPSNPNWVLDNYSVKDPVQGDTANCALIAALSSLAWIQKGLIPTATDPTRIPFYKEPNTPEDQVKIIEVNWELCVENSLLKYAHSSTPAEIWPAIYEKAYGSWKQGSTFIACSNYESVNWGGNPCTALTHLTNKASTTKLTSGKSSTTIRTDIRYKCYSNGKTKYPMVAYTYLNLTDPPDDVNPAHSYSLLGLYPNSSDANAEIVLRNPFGTNDDATAYSWPNLTNINEKGIFKITVAKFLLCFEAYGYVVI